MKSTIIANGKAMHCVLVPQTDLERSWMLSLGNPDRITVKRGQYKAVDGATHAEEGAVIITSPYEEQPSTALGVPPAAEKQ